MQSIPTAMITFLASDSGLAPAIGDAGLWVLAGIACLALAAEFIDSSLGMGYGTMLTPLLMILGLSRGAVVPAILVSELVTGATAAMCHHGAGNANLLPRRRRLLVARQLLRRYGLAGGLARVLPRHLRAALMLGGCSVVGAVAAVMLSLKLPKFVLNLYIGLLLVALGAFVLITLNRTLRFSWTRLGGLGLLAAFNKGVSGGGYGPLVVGGQLLAGQSARSAVGIVSLSEAMACLAGVCTFVLGGGHFDWTLTLTLTTGAVLSAPLASLAVKRVRQRRLRICIGLLTMVLGLLTLHKALV